MFDQSVAYAHNSASPKSTTTIESGTIDGSTLADRDHFEHSLIVIGDLDRDEIQDIAVGAAVH